MRKSLAEYFLDIAELIATRSTCLRREVGCVLVDERNHILSTGYNGSASGMDHCIDSFCKRLGQHGEESFNECIAVHAEENALIQCKNPFEITTCYVTKFPCQRCLRMLMNTSCMRIIYIRPIGLSKTRQIALQQWYLSKENRTATAIGITR